MMEGIILSLTGNIIISDSFSQRLMKNGLKQIVVLQIRIVISQRVMFPSNQPR